MTGLNEGLRYREVGMEGSEVTRLRGVIPAGTEFKSFTSIYRDRKLIYTVPEPNHYYVYIIGNRIVGLDFTHYFPYFLLTESGMEELQRTIEITCDKGFSEIGLL